MPTNVVQNEQGGEGQGEIVVNDVVKRRTKVRGVGKIMILWEDSLGEN